MIQNTRYLLGKILVFLTNFHSLVKQIIANCKFFCSVRNRILFLFIKKSWLFLKVLWMLFFLFHLMRRRQISWVDFARVIKAINQEEMMLRRCATAIAYCLDRSSFRMQTIYRVSNCPSNIQSRKKTKKFCGN